MSLLGEVDRGPNTGSCTVINEKFLIVGIESTIPIIDGDLNLNRDRDQD